MQRAPTLSQVKRQYGAVDTRDFRPSAAKRGYGPKWQKASAAYLKANPWCVQCAADDIREPATVTDHIIPHKGDTKLFWDRDNWQGLCSYHHNSKTVKQDGGFGN